MAESVGLSTLYLRWGKLVNHLVEVAVPCLQEPLGMSELDTTWNQYIR